MPAAILDQGRTSIRDALKALVTHVAVSTDNTAFAATQTAVNPSGSGTNLIKSATKTDVNGSTFDSTISIDGTSEFTGLTINTIALMKGAARTDAISRNVRTVGIGIQSGDAVTIGVRSVVGDNS